MEAVTYQKVQTKEEWAELRAFAASFSHTVDDSTRTPMFLIRRGGKLFGYFSVGPFPTLYPCFHPENTTPRDFVDAVNNIRSWQWLMSNGHERYPKGVCYVAAKTNLKTTRAMERMGFKKVADLYESIA